MKMTRNAGKKERINHEQEQDAIGGQERDGQH